MFIRLCITILLGLGLLFFYIKYLENNGIYYPIKDIGFYPSSIGLSYEETDITTEDGCNINGWFIPYPNAKYTLLFCHGNAGNIGDRIDKLDLLRRIGLNIFIVDYRGYGKSQGRPFENGFYLDAQAAYNYLLNTHNIKSEQIILYGESLGTAVVIDLASKKKVRAVIVEGAFSRGRDMAVKIYPFLPAFLFSNSFDSIRKITKINVPKLFIHSRNDEVVPFALASKLYNTAGEPKEFVEIIGGHNTAFLDSKEKYVSAIALFIEKF